MATKEKQATGTGQVVQVVGVVVDVEFKRGSLPAINNALKINLDGKKLLLSTSAKLLFVPLHYQQLMA